ncbi:hypothetical protein F4824DRAFT_161366 [Ustulina deusta]|nr:hypothetical protein F4824DRAFT_161366 [Ustulina deusta]
MGLRLVAMAIGAECAITLFGPRRHYTLISDLFTRTFADEDIPTGLALTTMAPLFGVSAFLGVGNSVFDTTLIGYVNALKIPGLDSRMVASAGATTPRYLVPQEYLMQVLNAYVEALRGTFRISFILTTSAIFGSVGMEWNRVRRHGSEKAVIDKPSNHALPYFCVY